jgi:hypothetical protein
VACVLHAHTGGMAASAIKCGLLPLSQPKAVGFLAGKADWVVFLQIDGRARGRLGLPR